MARRLLRERPADSSVKHGDPGSTSTEVSQSALVMPLSGRQLRDVRAAGPTQNVETPKGPVLVQSQGRRMEDAGSLLHPELLAGHVNSATFPTGSYMVRVVAQDARAAMGDALVGVTCALAVELWLQFKVSLLGGFAA